jgi:hypothetical protein
MAWRRYSAALVLLLSCSGARPEVPPDPVPVTGAALRHPPPVWVSVPLIDPDDPEALTCLDLEGAVTLRRQLLELRTWADLAWARCGHGD